MGNVLAGKQFRFSGNNEMNDRNHSESDKDAEENDGGLRDDETGGDLGGQRDREGC